MAVAKMMTVNHVPTKGLRSQEKRQQAGRTPCAWRGSWTLEPRASPESIRGSAWSLLPLSQLDAVGPASSLNRTPENQWSGFLRLNLIDCQGRERRSIRQNVQSASFPLVFEAIQWRSKKQQAK